MLSFLQQNAGTIVVGLLLAAVIILVLIKMVKNKKAGKSSCGSCAGCPYEANCHRRDGCGRYGKQGESTTRNSEKKQFKNTAQIEGMMCAMCEAHICDTIRKQFPQAKKVSASHRKGEAVFFTAAPIDTRALEAALEPTGYRLLALSSVPCK